MGNSSLISYTALSPNCSRRERAISKVTVHHMAGSLTVETCGRVFADPSRQASSNYGIGSDGRIALYVPEDKQAWTSSNWDNDQRAVTVEVANSSCGGDWPVSDAAWSSLVSLLADVCRRNGIGELRWTGDAGGSLTCHYMFAATACPGPYLKARMPELAAAVNAVLAGAEPPAASEQDGTEETPAERPLQPVAPVRYRARVGGTWLPEMRDWRDTSGSGDDFAGIPGQPIEYLAMDFPGWYQVRSSASGWLPKVRAYDIADLDAGCAGDGSPILAVRCYYETPDPASTGYKVIEYRAHTMGYGAWLPTMVDTSDTSGSGDDFAGDGSAIDCFRAKVADA